ncbi:hypothetical protein PISL3812_05731 [Talaromyces islandicus]|uniref:FAS1 domain-containing protein n=1 Tax=Talaromyces islandicus TaxID=28573 RepID=A0A0U1LZF1_TALIS|nr:hypothetical protein PISL3812_05731 [Talaromyces islandicus]
MKTSPLILLVAAPLAAGFVLPDEQQVLTVFSDAENTSPHYGFGQHDQANEVEHLVLPDLTRFAGHVAEGLQQFAAHGDHGRGHGHHPEELRAKGKRCSNGKGKKEKMEEKDRKDSSKHHPHQTGDVFDMHPHHKPGFFDKIKGHFRHIFGQYDHGRPHADGHHHRVYNQTIYQLISSSNHTRILTRIINQYDEVVQHLNSTEANYTVFAPVDEAFKHIHHKPENISKAAVLNWLKYHASPKVLTTRDFFDIQTVPTLLEDDFPQRISTQAGFKGLLLNFHSRVIRADIFASNGVIHGINNFLIPPLAAADAIDLAPSIFSTLNLALVKTGLIDEISALKGTLFAPSNKAFEKLGPKINAFLFSRAGEKYLKALLKYHLVPDHTVFSDAYYHSAVKDVNETFAHDSQHLDVPTLFHGKPVAIDIHHLHRLTHIVLNMRSHVGIPNIPVKEGVVHLTLSVIVPPRPEQLELEDQQKANIDEEHEHKYDHEHDEFKHKRRHEHKDEYDHEHEHEHLSVRDLMERLDRFIE